MVWTRILAYSACMAVGLFAGLVIAFAPLHHPIDDLHKRRADAGKDAAQTSDEVPAPRPVSDEDQARILRALVAHYAEQPSPAPDAAPREQSPRLVVLARESLTLCRHTPELIDFNCPEERPTSWVPQEWRRQLIGANERSRAQPSVADPLVETWSAAEFARLLEAERYDGFYARYPDSAGFVEVSWGVLVGDGNTALVFAARSCGGHCGRGVLHTLTRTGDAWRIVQTELFWIA